MPFASSDAVSLNDMSDNIFMNVENNKIILEKNPPHIFNDFEINTRTNDSNSFQTARASVKANNNPSLQIFTPNSKLET